MFGLERDEVATVLDEWPSASDEDVQNRVVNNSMNHLLGYPHGASQGTWGTYISSSIAEVAGVLSRWRDDDGFDGSGFGYFSRLM